MINLCIPTLNRYDLLYKCIDSAMQGTVKPDQIWIINNGNLLVEIKYGNVRVYNPEENLGVAASWNWFSKNVPETRIICNDDVEFFPDSIEKLVTGVGDKGMYCPEGMMANAFSCFILPEKIVQLVGYFDETISPNYAYFEDNDYYRRMQLLGIDIIGIPGCLVKHIPSSTLNNLTSQEKARHHDKFKQARYRYKLKWGGEPGREVFKTPYGR